MFLDLLDVASSQLRITAAPRTYRASFTRNYRAIFPDEARHYRTDVLEMCLQRQVAFWVNGTSFELSAETKGRGDNLQQAWSRLGALLELWSHRSSANTGPPVSEVRGAIAMFDKAWAAFEHHCITEMISIEERARGSLVRAVEEDRHLRSLEQASGPSAKHLPELRRLAEQVAQLNAAANTARKGRGDLSVEVLERALAEFQRGEAVEAGAEQGAPSAARFLAGQVLDSFAALRQYLREVGGCMERVDPHLGRNPGLVARLADWEESWELGVRYVQDADMLRAVCGLVAKIRDVQRRIPAFADACETCDVELFLVLPRLAWLCFLEDPSAYGRLFRLLLPHRFVPDATTPEALPTPGAELQALLQRFRGAAGLKTEAASSAVVQEVVRGLFAERAVAGPQGPAGVDDSRDAECCGPTREAVEAFLHELEGWSLELQRHCPEDWNQCSAVLLQCLSGARQGRRQSETFRV